MSEVYRIVPVPTAISNLSLMEDGKDAGSIRYGQGSYLWLLGGLTLI